MMLGKSKKIGTYDGIKYTQLVMANAMVATRVEDYR
jgi:hypothetical protein